jgi:hypothetical protein
MALFAEFAQQVSQGFLALWSRYPNKNNKKGSEKLYNRVVTPEIDAKIHRALDWQIPEWEALEWYTPPHLTTYINQERYEDEPTPKKATTTASRPIEIPEWKRRHLPQERKL